MFVYDACAITIQCHGLPRDMRIPYCRESVPDVTSVFLRSFPQLYFPNKMTYFIYHDGIMFVHGNGNKALENERGHTTCMIAI